MGAMTMRFFSASELKPEGLEQDIDVRGGLGHGIHWRALHMGWHHRYTSYT